MKHQSNSLSRLILVYLPGTFIPTFINLLFTAIFTRMLHADEYGKFCFIISITTFITALSSQWLQQAINRYIPQSNSENDLSGYNNIISFSIFLLIIILALSSLLVKIFLHNSFKDWEQFYTPTAVFLIISTVYSILLSTLQSKLMAKNYAIFNFLNSIAKLSASYILLAVFLMGPLSLIWGATISIIVLLPFLWIKAGVTSPLAVFRNGKLSSLVSGTRQFASYGLPMTGWFIASTSLAISDRYIIQWFRGSSEVGIYSANSSLVTGVAAVIAMPITLAIHPFMMKLWNSGDREQTKKTLADIIELYLTLGLIVVALTRFFSKDIVLLLLGKEFHEGYVVLPIIIGGVVAWQLSTYTHKPIEFVGRTILMMWMCLICASLSIILNIIFIPKYGYIAAAYSTLVSYLLYNIIVSVIGRKILNWKLNLRRLTKNILVIFSCYLLIAFVRAKLHITFTYSYELLASIFLSIVMLLILIFCNLDIIKKYSKKSATPSG